MKSRKDFFQTINNFPHSLAVYFTFTLDKEVIDKIAENSYGNIIILHDYRQGVSLKNNWDNRIVCIPVNTYNQQKQNCFHSKLALLKGDDKAKLLLGSVNLSRNSFSKEKEICFEIDLEFNSDFYNSVINYIQSLIPQTHTSTEVLKNAINKFRFSNEQVKKKSGLSFTYDSITTSISDNICKQIYHDEQPILKIASPYLSNDFKTELSDFINQVNPNEIQLYLRKNYPVPDEFKSFHNLKLFQPKPRSTRNGFHAKLISIEYSNKEIVFIGSANFSRQGFFWNLEQIANQECGVIINQISINQKHILDDWFNEGWEKPQTIDEWTENENLAKEPEEIFKDEPYVWAEKLNEKEVTLFFHIVDTELQNKVYADGNKLQLKCKDKNLNIFQCNCKLTGNTIRVQIGNDFEETIVIFESEMFENNVLKYDDLFTTSNDRMDSINYKEMSDEIDKNGIKILGSNVIEPPKLEHYFQIVKNNVRFIKSKKQFNEFHFERLKVKLEENANAEGIYLATQLYNVFSKKLHNKFANLCLERIKELLNENNSLNINFKNYCIFLKKWKNF